MVEARSLKKPSESGNKEDLNPSKFYSKFIFKALILALFYSVVPFFLSQTPELANQTRLLELLHLILVGIAVSYGLFSRRNHDGGGRGSNTNDQKPDQHNNNSYVPKILEVSSVFNVDHESESEPSDDFSSDHGKFQTWMNKYQMKIPEVSSGIREKPLLLPVRSLNYSRVSESDPWEKVRSKRQLLKSLGDDDNSDVLPSPIPWRSRSFSSSTEIESQPSVKNSATVDLQPLIKTRPNLSPSSSFSSPRKTTPLTDIASEPGVKFYGKFHSSPPPPSPPPPPPPLPDFYDSASGKESPEISRIVRKESVHKTKLSGGPPPPPPPPPLPDFYYSASRKNSSESSRLERRESVRQTKFSGGESHPPPPPPPPPLPDFYNSATRKNNPGSSRLDRRESVNNTKLPCCEFHPSPPPPPPPPPPEYYKAAPTKSKVSSERRKPSEQKKKLDDNSAKRNSSKKVWWSDPIIESKEDRIIKEDTENTNQRSFLGNKATEESEDEEHRSRENEIQKREEEEGGGGSNNVSDVDKKADEFIAKFREQIRLQRIESIKRSANKISASSSR